jgi:uncharacterized membrane protein YjdF
MKGSRKANFYQICSAVSVTNFVFILYYATPIVSVLPLIQKLFQRHRMPCVGYLQLLYYCHPVIGAAYFQAAEMLKR